VVAAVVAARIEGALARGGVDRAARIGHARLGMDGTAAPVGPLSATSLTAREREKLDTAWRLLRQPPFNSTCLRRALVGAYFLRGHDPLLRIGVAKTEGAVSAHAWIEIDGIGLDPDGAERFTVLRPLREGTS
jgi:hypothetical protein